MLLPLTSPMYLAAVKAFACKDIDETISICTNICFYCLYLIDVLARIYLHPLRISNEPFDVRNLIVF